MRSMQRLFTVCVLTVFLGGLGGLAPLPETAPAQTADPVFVGAGDITNCSGTRDESTAQLLDSIAGTVFTLGDNAYPDGTLTEFNNCYGPTWGRHKNRTRPAPGNHDYNTLGAAGYYTYFGATASPLDTNCTSDCKGYYSYNLGAWHIIALNSEINHAAGSVQEQWLRADLAGNQSMCTLAYWHKPRFSSGAIHGNDTSFQPFWQALYDYGADVVLNGHDHEYERFAPQSPTGQADPTRGIREFVVGTGGAGLYSFSTIQPNSEVRNNTTWGVLKLTLHTTSYNWEFVPIAGQTFTDAGSGNCVSAGPAPTVTRTPTPGPTATRSLTPTVTRTPTIGPSITPTKTPTNTPNSSDLIFADGFESGNFSAWSSASTGGGNLSVSASAALVGSTGLQSVISGATTMYAQDDSPNAEPRYRARFYFDPNSLVMTSGDYQYILVGFANSTNTAVLRVAFKNTSGVYQLQARILNDSAVWQSTPYISISDAPHTIEVDWAAASAVGANDGYLTFWIDGIQQGSLVGVDDDSYRMERVRLGMVYSSAPGTSGTYFFDAFESRRQTYIGPANSVPTLPAPTATPTSVSPATNTPLSTPTRTRTPTSTRTPTPTSTRTLTPTTTTMHIGDLDRLSTSQNGGWTANVTITVHDANHNPVANATVSGTWSNGASGTASCTTGSNGKCSVSISGISKGKSSVTFTVNNVTRAASTYISANNHDPDGDSNGVRIVVARP